MDEFGAVTWASLSVRRAQGRATIVGVVTGRGLNDSHSTDHAVELPEADTVDPGVMLKREQNDQGRDEVRRSPKQTEPPCSASILSSSEDHSRDA